LDPIDLILRNVAEPHEEFVMTLDEIKEIAREGGRPNTYVGYEPSGPIHVGTLITIYKLRDMIEAGFHSIALMADIHAILNLKGPQEVIKEVSMTYWKTVFHELGSPDIEIVLGSDFELSEDYVMDLLTLSQKVTVNRAWRAMTVIARGKDPMVSHIVYPLMQALDILYLGVKVAIGGTDQRKIHALARDVFSSPVNLRVEKYVPSAIHMPLIPGLEKGGKMSSSIPKSHIAVHDPPEIIASKVRAAFCPPWEESFDEEGKLINPMLAAMKYLILPWKSPVKLPRSRSKGGGEIEIRNYEELAKAYREGEIHPLDLKNFVAEHFINEFKGLREKFMSDPDLLRPLYELQKWQKERGLFGEKEWKDALESYKPYLGDV